MNNSTNSKRPIAPPGFEILNEQCLKIYPDQTNPLQVTTVLKYWLGGQDPLDYISMYHNPGNPSTNIPPHWHYVSFGLSDLHGDGRVHSPETTAIAEPRSGMGFELTFRLIKEPNEGISDRPPTWPANLLQSLARYVFQTNNRLCAGDNIPWRKPLNNKTSKIEHMLIAEDPQLQRTETPFGWVDFLQIVGVTSEELEQASRWNGKGVLNLLRKDSTTGGEWLITDMSRSQSVFEMFPDTLEQLEDDLEREGSDLAGVNADFVFKELAKTKIKIEIDSTVLNEQCMRNENNKLNEDWLNAFENSTIKKEQIDHEGSEKDIICPIVSQPNLTKIIPLDGLELILDPYAAKFLLLAVKDRIRHGRHFTLKSQNLAVTFVSESVTGSIVNKENPYGILGYWMQILITDDLIPRMLEAFKHLEIDPETMQIPQTFEWPDKNLRFIIDHPSTDLLNQQGPILAAGYKWGAAKQCIRSPEIFKGYEHLKKKMISKSSLIDELRKLELRKLAVERKLLTRRQGLANHSLHPGSSPTKAGPASITRIGWTASVADKMEIILIAIIGWNGISLRP